MKIRANLPPPPQNLDLRYAHDFHHHQIREWHVMTYIKVDAIIHTLNNARDIVFLLVYCGIIVRASQISQKYQSSISKLKTTD